MLVSIGHIPQMLLGPARTGIGNGDVSLFLSAASLARFSLSALIALCVPGRVVGREPSFESPVAYMSGWQPLSCLMMKPSRLGTHTKSSF